MEKRMEEKDSGMKCNKGQVTSLDHSILYLEHMLWKMDPHFLGTMQAFHGEHSLPHFCNSHHVDGELP